MTPIKLTISLVSLCALVGGCSKGNDRDSNQPDEMGYESTGEMSANDDRMSENQPGMQEQTAPTQTGQATAAQTSSATSSIAQARCAREQHCENIGFDQKYSSFSDCETSVRNDWRDDLNARECERGVDQEQLDECLIEIRNEDCANPFDSLGRMASCTTGQICRG